MSDEQTGPTSTTQLPARAESPSMGVRFGVVVHDSEGQKRPDGTTVLDTKDGG